MIVLERYKELGRSEMGIDSRFGVMWVRLKNKLN